MSRVKTTLAKLVGLFVDDGRFALALALWIGLARLLALYPPLPESWQGIVFFAGLALILVASARRRARNRPRSRSSARTLPP